MGDAPGVELHRRVMEAVPSDEHLRRWERSGVAGLSGPPDGSPRRPPASVLSMLAGVERELRVAANAAERRCWSLDVVELLGERAAVHGWRRAGRRSLGGATQLLAASDGWVAVALARPEDTEMVPAWLGSIDIPTAIARRDVASLVDGGAELGLAVAGLGETSPSDRPAFAIRSGRTRQPLTRWADVTVVDCSSLWAGPLCTSLLTALGARVIKVESTGRPDGARRGPPVLFDLLHTGQESVALDFATPEGRRRLRELIERADVVVEASRPRALAQLGVDADAAVDNGAVWLSITGHGRDRPTRVAFGDDAAVAGGLVTGPPEDPRFCVDAVADPLSGLLGAAAVIELLTNGRGGLIDLSMAATAAWAGRSGPDPRPLADPSSPLRARHAVGVAPALGVDTTRILAELDID